MSRRRAAVVGGGIVGVAVARRLAQDDDSIDVTLFEKEDGTGAAPDLHQRPHRRSR
jgi:protoporphyrinogen oxidase